MHVHVHVHCACACAAGVACGQVGEEKRVVEGVKPFGRTHRDDADCPPRAAAHLVCAWPMGGLYRLCIVCCTRCTVLRVYRAEARQQRSHRSSRLEVVKAAKLATFFGPHGHTAASHGALSGSAARPECAAQPRRLESPPQEARAARCGTAKTALLKVPSLWCRNLQTWPPGTQGFGSEWLSVSAGAPQLRRPQVALRPHQGPPRPTRLTKPHQGHQAPRRLTKAPPRPHQEATQSLS